jgi:phytoene dehydrogenase-like protein
MYDVVVVGAGIGGLTVAALLSARGLSTCLLERQSQVGGCIGRVEFSGYDFEPGMGLYTSFGAGRIYEQIFFQLPVEPPAASLITSHYTKRSIDGSDVTLSQDDLYAIDGGPASLAERLAESLKLSGGNLRLNSPVLRLAYDDANRAIGVDLLSGERVQARKAIVSNMTVWDTYGKLVGLNRTPPEIKKQLNTLRGTGVYIVYAVLEATAVGRLPGELMLVQDGEGEFTMAIAPASRAAGGKRAVTFTCRTEVEPWFAYQSSVEDYEEWDQDALEQFWTRLHRAIPELGSDIEIIESANPRSYYEQTRRKLGMVLGVESTVKPTSRTFLPNVFMVGDTVSAAANVESVVEMALILAQEISGQTLIV